jgi:hypothetical protein
MYLLFLLAVAGYAIYFLASGSLNPASTYMMDFSPDNARDLPLQVPRLIDLFIALAPLGFVIFATFTYELRDERLRATYGNARIKSSITIGWGWFFGICGSILVLLGGLSIAIIGSAISAFCIARFTIGWYTENNKYQGWSRRGEMALIQSATTDWIAILIIFSVTTYIHGAIAATIYALAMLLSCLVVHGLTTSSWVLFKRTGPKLATKFKHTMLECDIDSETC